MRDRIWDRTRDSASCRTNVRTNGLTEQAKTWIYLDHSPNVCARIQRFNIRRGGKR